MNAEVRVLLADGERAVRSDDRAAAREAFLEAGRSAASYQLWRAALRCYRRVLELDLVDREPLARIARLSARVVDPADWRAYAHAIKSHAWPSFGCRAARIVIGQHSQVECPGVGLVMELRMSADDLIETRPAPRFSGMPLAMAMIILRRAMWMSPRDLAADPTTVRVAFDGRQQVRLDETGDWSLERDPS